MTTTAPQLQDVIMDDDPVVLQVLLDSYMEHAAGMLASPQQQQGGTKLNQTPPASADMIKHLPILELRPEDLVDPVNRECCICLDDNNEGDLAIRLPNCSHIFHKKCILDWLQRKCTCPVCRYEYPTDDAAFELERQERLRQCKPRYARHELHRMDHASLLALLPASDQTNNNVDKACQDHMVERVIASGSVELTNLPEPIVEYQMSTLRKMSVSQLKKVMNKQAGVFWNKEVSSRKDLIQVFLASGRLRVLPEPSEAPTSSRRSAKNNRPKHGHHHKSRETDHIRRGLQLRKALRLWFGRRRHRSA